MRQFVDRYGKYILLAGLLTCGSLLKAQGVHSIRVVTKPAALDFYVDGTSYHGSATLSWPVGSKHTLRAIPSQGGQVVNTRYTFTSWSTEGTTISPGGGTVVVTADTSIREIVATFNVEYLLSLRFFACSNEPCLSTPATIYAGSAAYRSDADLWVAPDSSIVFQAVPSTGYVFLGWQLGSSALMPTFNLTVVVDTPKGVYPRFGTARTIRFDSAPTGFKIIADRTLMDTPGSLEWAWDTDHMLGATSPQQDTKGLWWVFSAWSDGGATHHSYRVQPGSMPASVTATFIPAVPVDVVSSPRGLKLKVDGQDAWPNYKFYWGVGDKHRIEAPAKLTDEKGRTYMFKAWTHGGAAIQDVYAPEEAHTGGLLLVATYAPLASITATSSLAGVAVSVDGFECAKPCVLERIPGAPVKLSVPATVAMGEGSRADFSGWSDGVNTPARELAAPEEPLAVVASYRIMNRLTTGCDPAEGPQVQVAPGSGDGFYEASVQVGVTASARPGFKFRQWEGDLGGASPAAVLSMNAPRSVRAVFDRIPYVPPAGVRNAAGEIPADGVAPGSVVSIYGANLASELAKGPENPLVQTLGGVTVRLGDRLLPIFFVAPDQINVQIPSSVEPGEQTLIVRWDGHPEVRVQTKILRNAPGLFQTTAGELRVAVAIHENGTAVSADSPAKRGERITVYGTGFGPCDHPRPDGFALPYDPQYLIADAAEVAFDGVTLRPESAFAAPERTGVDAFTFRIPAAGPTGPAIDLKVRINGVESNKVTLPVQ